jgi:nucleotide-binding universal stress UspA family protein
MAFLAHEQSAMLKHQPRQGVITMYERIVVPLDGSDIAEQALAPAEDMARRLGVPLHLLRVADVSGSDYTYVYGYMVDAHQMAERMDLDRKLASEYLDEITRSLQERGFAASSELRIGDTVKELVAAMAPGDLYVMASHGRSGIARWYLGSVAETIVRTATVPVMLIRAETSHSTKSSRAFHQPARA